MDELFIALNKFGHISKELRYDLESMLTRVTLEKKAFLLREKEVCRNVWYLEKGIIRIYKDGKTREITSWIQPAGQIVTDTESFHKKTQSDKNIQTLAPSVLWGLSHDGLDELCIKHKEFNRIWLNIEIHYRDIETRRGYAWQNSSSLEKLEYAIKYHPEIFIKGVTIPVLASYFDTTPNNYSKIKKELQLNGSQINQRKK